MKKSVIIFFLSLLAVDITGQTIDLQKNMKLANEYRFNYQFEKAIEIYSRIIKQASDSNSMATATKWLTVCQNGQSMLRYADKPTVLGKQTVPLEEFFRFYDFNFGGHWALVPSSWLHSKPGKVDYVSPVFVPDGDPTQLFYASPGLSGNTGWDIYVIKKISDAQWSAPERLNDAVNSPYDELFPYSPDGKTLYFASNGHFGMGGFDLYKSTFDVASQTWGAPENLGFPYSSPYDDLLYVPDREGPFAYFASTREQEQGFITLYKIVRPTNPIKQSLTDLKTIQAIAGLNVALPNDVSEPQKTAGTQEAAEYVSLAKNTKESKQKLNDAQKQLDALRNQYETTQNETARQAVAGKILAGEAQLLPLQENVRQAEESLYRAGEKLKAKGVAIPDVAAAGAKQETTSTATTFSLQKRDLASLESLQVQPPSPPEPEIDLSFRVGGLSEVHSDYPAVSGLIYRIQLGVFSHKVEAKLWRGISPVFVEKTPTGKWLYAAGQFTTYNEAAKALTEVKKRNFGDAIIIARLDNKSITVKAAREEELKPKKESASINEFYQVELGVYASGLPPELLAAVKKITDNEIAKSGNAYVIGGFASREEADNVKDALLSEGFAGVKVDVIKK